LKQAYQLFPLALQQELVLHEGHFRGLPLHWACRYGTTSDVMQFLIDAFPDPLFHRHDCSRMPVHGGGQWPLHMAFQAKLPSRYLIVPQKYWPGLSTFQQLWQAGPKCFATFTASATDAHSETNVHLGSNTSASHTNRFSWTPLEWAIYTHQTTDIQAYFAEQFLRFSAQPQQKGINNDDEKRHLKPHWRMFQLDLSNAALLADIEQVEEDDGHATTSFVKDQALFDHEHAMLLVPVLSKVQKLELLLGDTSHRHRTQIYQKVVTPEAWKKLLSGLEINGSVTHLCIKGLPTALPVPELTSVRSHNDDNLPPHKSRMWWDFWRAF